VLADHFAALIPSNHSVLDVGCGDGLIAALILQRRHDLTIHGVDILERPASHIAVTRFDGQRLPFADRSFETAILCDVLHHTERPLQMLEEATRVARHTVVIKDHRVRGVLARSTLRFMDFIGNAPHGVVLPYNYLTDEEWSRAFQACGLNRREERRQLRMYPMVVDWIFGRSLHFISSFDVAG
jgi:SAM-dependent methyltransferase